MQFLEFKNYFSPYIVFSTKEIEKVFPKFNNINLLTWQKKNYITKLRNSRYIFTNSKSDNNSFGSFSKEEYLLYFISNKIYSPSYISLETALSYYGLIPEAVFTISSVSTLKTNSFKNKFGNFKYSNLKPNLFFGYQIIKINNYFFKIAEIEKTILDYLYLNSSIKSIDDLIELRLNKFILANEVNFPKIYEYATIYKSKSLIKKIKILKQFVND